MHPSEHRDWPGLDPQLAAWLAAAPTAPPGSGIEVLREYSRQANALAFGRTRPSLIAPHSADDKVDGPGGPIPVRIYTPAEPGGPLLVYFHGGGWIQGDLDTAEAATNRLCVEAGAVVVSVGYRLAPTHRFPAAFDDCLVATAWAVAEAARLGADPARLVVAGDSAGGQLAASVALARRDAGAPVAAQLLLYPVIDTGGRYADPAVNDRYPSRAAHAGGPALTLAGMRFCSERYVDDADSGDWRVSPIAADLRGVAPAVVHTSGLDVLGSEGARYADALRAQGVRVSAREFGDLCHGYFGRGAVSAAADAAAALAARDLREVLAP
jgi:acetyl esterase